MKYSIEEINKMLDRHFTYGDYTSAVAKANFQDLHKHYQHITDHLETISWPFCTKQLLLPDNNEMPQTCINQLCEILDSLNDYPLMGDETLFEIELDAFSEYLEEETIPWVIGYFEDNFDIELDKDIVNDYICKYLQKNDNYEYFVETNGSYPYCSIDFEEVLPHFIVKLWYNASQELEKANKA